MRRWLFLLTVAGLVVFGTARAQGVRFVAKTFDYQSTTLPYREAIIHPESDAPTLLVVLLHSRHSCGSGNDAHLTADGVKEVKRWLNGHQRRAVLLVPQCPEGREWNERSPRGCPLTEVVKALIDQYLASAERLDTTSSKGARTEQPAGRPARPTALHGYFRT